jgi:hypothetical protein
MMNRVLAIVILMAAVGSAAFAGFAAPEIDASSGAATIGLLGGAVLILRSRKKK